jgi:hypothetical protein
MFELLTEISQKFNNARYYSDIKIYFHNLGYDGRFMLANDKISSMIKKGTKIYSEKFGPHIEFKDSYAMIPMKLSKFSKSFNLGECEKEVFPYKYYTYDRVKEALENRNTDTGIVNEALNYIPNKDHSHFIKNTKHQDAFNMIDYCKYYCDRDVEVLSKGFTQFRKDVMLALGDDLDPINTITMPGLAAKYCDKFVFKDVSGLYKYSSMVRDYFQTAVQGGRCMCANNNKWIINDELYDFDARSLYPSAIKRGWLVCGTPTVYEDNSETQYNKDNLPDFLQRAYEEQQLVLTKGHDVAYCVMTINIIKVNKHYAFPICLKREHDKQTNTDNDLPIETTVDLIQLQDLINFQDITFTIKHGYIWQGDKCNRDNSNKQPFEDLYQLRRKAKDEGNSVQEVYKLLLNSSYGKQLQKPITHKDKFFKNKEDYNKYRWSHNNSIESVIELANGGYIVHERLSVDTQFNNVVFALMVLSFSKRIMNEVMCLAEELGIRIYYQDTDSMHIQKSRLNDLCEAYYKKYNRKLIGSQLGQFHSDFDELSGDDIHTICSIFCCKKMYYDLITNEKGEFAEHYRCKGIPQEAIKGYCKDNNMSIFELYYNVARGKSYVIDIAKYTTSFNMGNDGKIITNETFTRTMKTEYEFGYDSLKELDVEKYKAISLKL